MAARTDIIGQGADIFHTVRPQQNGGQGQSGQGGGFAVPRQGGGMDGFTRPVGATVGGQEHINRRGGLFALDPTVGQVELGVGQRQECGISRAIARHHHGRGGTGRATDQPGVKAGIAICIGGDAGKDFIGDRQQVNRHARLRPGAAQRAHKDVQAVGAA